MVVFDNDNNSARDTDSHFGSSHFGSRGFPPPSLHVPGRTLSGGGPRFRGLPTADTCAWPSLRGPLSAVPSRRPRRALRRRRQPLEPRRRLLRRPPPRERQARTAPPAHPQCRLAGAPRPWPAGRPAAGRHRRLSPRYRAEPSASWERVGADPAVQSD